MNLNVIPSHCVDEAWLDGAACLTQACDTVEEITGDQLKLILSRGERWLIALRDEDKTVGWGVAHIQQLPNCRVFFIDDLVAPHAHFERFTDLLKEMALSQGCLRIRCASRSAQARLFRIKTGFQPIYEILELKI